MEGDPGDVECEMTRESMVVVIAARIHLAQCRDSSLNEEVSNG